MSRSFNLSNNDRDRVTRHETTFEFIERGGRPEGVAIRPWFEKWYRIYPNGHRETWKTRLKSKHYREFMGAYFELQAFAMLRRLNCRVEIHPCFSETSGTVDFLATHGQVRFYMEATVCGVNQGIAHSSANEEDAVRKIKENVTNSHSDVWLSATGELSNTLRTDPLIKPIRELLDLYTADEVRRLHDGNRRDCPRTSINEGDWTLDVSLLPPLTSDGRGQVWGPCRGGPMDGSLLLARTLSKKAQDWNRKKLKQESFLIVVNNCHSDYSWGDERSAIYDHPAPNVDEEAFSQPLSHVAGVIVFGNAILGREHSAPVKMYRNRGHCIPECLQFLTQEQTLSELLGIGSI